MRKLARPACECVLQVAHWAVILISEKSARISTKNEKNCTDIMYRNQDADLRKVCTKVQARCRGPLRASHTLPYPDLWLVDENN